MMPANPACSHNRLASSSQELLPLREIMPAVLARYGLHEEAHKSNSQEFKRTNLPSFENGGIKDFALPMAF